MTTKKLVVSDHEAYRALPFLSRFGSERPGVPELRRKLQDVAADKQKLAVELNEDELRLLVDGYEDQAATLWVTGVHVGKGLVKDEESPFSPEQTDLYRRMKRALYEQERND
ncbi:MAG TPA: hypothetical protein VM537_26450 [Anaerolineae bacterium]|nr:hypothetical protein [Anaerolineae bacterium]